MRPGTRIGLMALLAVLAGPMMPETASAQDDDPVQDQITAALTDQGYEIMLVTRTWLGRLRIVAESDDLRREIVINPSTGEVLRDYSVLLVARETAGPNGFEDESDNDRDGTNVASARTTGDGSDPALSAMEVMGDSVAIVADPVGE